MRTSLLTGLLSRSLPAPLRRPMPPTASLGLPTPPPSGSWRAGASAVQPGVGCEPFLEDHPWTRSLEFGSRLEYLADPKGRPQTVHMELHPFGINPEDGDSFEVSVGRLFERLNAPFDILDDGQIVLPPDAHATYSRTRQRRHGGVSAGVGGTAGGHVRGLEAASSSYSPRTGGARTTASLRRRGGRLETDVQHPVLTAVQPACAPSSTNARPVVPGRPSPRACNL